MFHFSGYVPVIVLRFTAGTHAAYTPAMDNVIHNGRAYSIEDLSRYMDDDIRERVHARVAPCSAQAFWDAYVAADPRANEVAALAPSTTVCWAIQWLDGLVDYTDHRGIPALVLFPFANDVLRARFVLMHNNRRPVSARQAARLRKVLTARVFAGTTIYVPPPGPGPVAVSGPKPTEER